MQYIISGKVIKGDGYGRKLGFPTVNLKPIRQAQGEPEELPHEGVYSGVAFLEGKTYRSGIVVGPNAKIEAHLLRYNGDAYGKQVVLTTQKFLRKYKKFDTEAELINQIKKDIEQC